MSKFEIEHRGVLTSTEKAKLERFLNKKGKPIKEYKRTQWIFGLNHDKKIDLRVKETNGDYEFSLKVGTLGSASRKEISIPFSKDKSQQALEFLKFLGHREGLKAVRNAKIYLYKGIEWAIVEVPNHSYYFEAEKLVDNKREGKDAEEEIKAIAKELGLTIFSPQETVAYIRTLDREANKSFRL